MRWDHSTLNDWLCLTQDQYYSYFSQIFSLFTLRPLESSTVRGWRRIGSPGIFGNFLNLRYVTLHIARSGIEYSEDVARARSMSWPMLCRGILMGISSGTWSLPGSGGALSVLIWYLVVTMLPQILQHRGRGADPILTWSLISIWEETCFRALLKTRLTLQWCSKSDTRMNGRAQEQSQTWGHVSHWSQTRRMDSSVCGDSRQILILIQLRWPDDANTPKQD